MPGVAVCYHQGMAGLSINIEGELQRLRRQVTSFKRKGLPKASRDAINKAGKAARKVAVKAVAEARNIRTPTATKGVKFARATAKGREARIIGTGSMIPLIEVKGSKPQSFKKGGGVSARTRKGAGKTLVKGSFFATVPGGHLGIYKRKGTPRLPIKELTLPSVAHTLVSEPITKQIFDEFERRLTGDLLKDLSRAVRKARRTK